MQAVIFIGIQATGKSTYYKNRFFHSHVRLSLDLLNTRKKQQKFLNTCLSTQSKFVVDNTNPTLKEREQIINISKEHKYEVVGYYFSSEIEDAINRNNKRTGKQKIPEKGIWSCFNRLVIPDYKEGFDKLFFVKIENDKFLTEDWKKKIKDSQPGKL